MRQISIALLLLVLLSSHASSAPTDGFLEGLFEPGDSTVRISAMQDAAVVSSAEIKTPDGKFRLRLPAGTYTIVVTSPASSFPIHLEEIAVRTGETTVLPALLIVAGSGKAMLSGRVVPALPDSEVALYSGGNERASVRTDREGGYEFTGLPAGRYEVRASAPGHSQDRAPVTIPENQRVRQTAVLLPIVATDGVDWTAGRIRATGIGEPPKNAANAAQARAMAQRAAVTDGQRNLLRIVETIKLDGQRTVGSIMRSGQGDERIQGFVKGYTVVSERQLDDGRIEVILELPLTGVQGLTRFLAE